MVTGKKILAFQLIKGSGNRYLLVLVLWIILTAINIDKAFHIDDTFHLKAAEWILNNPDRPMSGLINWEDIPTPIFSHNQPPLFFYLIALTTGIFGVNEVPLHLLLSLFTFLSLLTFLRIIEFLSLRNRNLLMILFAFCPALIVNQNLMTDVPLLAIILLSALFLLKAGNSEKLKFYSLTALLLGLGLLIKYSILPLLIVSIIVILSRRDYRHLLVMAIPLTMLFLWSTWNYAEYGSIHFLDRPKGELHINRLWAFLACTGSMSTFSFSFIYSTYRNKFTRNLVLLVIALLFVQALLFIADLIPQKLNSAILNVAFVANGFLVFFTLLRLMVLQIKKAGYKHYITSDLFIILLYIGSTAAFMVLFAPFIATRHLLLIVPFIIIFGHDLLEKATPFINRISLGLTLSLGLILGISDLTYADYYRKMALTVKIPEGKTVWTTGHWGWQWYAEKRGFKSYALNQSPVKAGDYFVLPGNISRQKTGKNLKLTLVEKKWEEADFLTFFSGNDFASLYSSSVKVPPWTFSVSPIDTIYTFKVVGVQMEP